MLLHSFLEIVMDWRGCFPQQRSYRRAVRQALGSLVCLGRRTLSRIIWTNGGQHRSWGAEYFLHARCRWDPQQLFDPILQRALQYCPGPVVAVAVDDTRLRKSGRMIAQAFYQRNPMSPPFHVNLMLGLRFLQASLLVPLHKRAPTSCRALPIRFQEVSPVKRPSRRADAQAWAQYRQASKRHNLSQGFVQMMLTLRQQFDRAGAINKMLVLSGDGSFCNRTCFAARVDRTELIARARKDAVLCFRASPGSRRFYDRHKFTPEQVRQDPLCPWRTTKLFYGGKRRKIDYKQVTTLYWQGGARRRLLRLLVVAPTPYRKRQGGRFYYRQPAYLLTTDLHTSARQLLQIYFDRWQIEINHRDEKDTLGVGQAQLWNINSVPKQPALAVAAYSALLLASLNTFGVQRGAGYAQLPHWRRSAKRPSCLDMVTLLRKEVADSPDSLVPWGFIITDRSLTSAAAA